MFSRSLVRLSAITITSNSALVLSPHLGRTLVDLRLVSSVFYCFFTFGLSACWNSLVSLPRSDEVGHFWGHIMQGLVIAFVHWCAGLQRPCWVLYWDKIAL